MIDYPTVAVAVFSVEQASYQARFAIDHLLDNLGLKDPNLMTFQVWLLNRASLWARLMPDSSRDRDVYVQSVEVFAGKMLQVSGLFVTLSITAFSHFSWSQFMMPVGTAELQIREELAKSYAEIATQSEPNTPILTCVRLVLRQAKS